MENNIANICSTLEMVANNMLKNEDLDDKLRVQIHTLRQEVNSTNNEAVKRILSKLSDIENQNEKDKKKIDDIVSRIEGEEGKVQKKSNSSNHGGIKISLAVICIALLLSTSDTTADNLGHVLDPLEKLANTLGCQDYGQVPRAYGNNKTTWSYQGTVRGIKWKITGICTDTSTGTTEVVFEDTRKAALEICFAKLQTRLPK